MSLLDLVLCTVLCAWAAQAFEGEEGSYHESSYHHGTFIYHGIYHGECGKDGLYWRDHSSLIICTHGTAYVQPCAPGTRNAPSRFEHGHSYGVQDFCNVNLVDYGYAAKYRQHEPEHPKVEEHHTGYESGHHAKHDHKVEEHGKYERHFDKDSIHGEHGHHSHQSHHSKEHFAHHEKKY